MVEVSNQISAMALTMQETQGTLHSWFLLDPTVRTSDRGPTRCIVCASSGSVGHLSRTECEQ